MIAKRTANSQVLIIDDQASMRHMLKLVLEKEGYRVTEAADGKSGLTCLTQGDFQVVLCDIRMPGMDGRDFLRQAVKLKTATTLIMMSAYGSLDSAIECMKEGAYDYIAKPFKPDEVVLTLRKAEERQRLVQENVQLKQELQDRQTERKLIAQSAGMQSIMKLISRVADSRSPVLITGETGTGKELVARALHAGSNRCDKPFLAVNCGAIPANLVESELFGHAKGAFTGADRERKGLFAAADGGTLFLDEIGELPLDLQPKLLRVLQEKEIRRVGENRSSQVDVRILTATARDLNQAIGAKTFRDDLYYRLAVIEIAIPPLRKRLEDIQPLAELFLQRTAQREGRPTPVMTPEVFALLNRYSWPGNVRELENFIEKTLIFCRSKTIDCAQLPWDERRHNREMDDGQQKYSLKKAFIRLEREYILKTLAVTGGNRTKAAELLEISLRSLHYKIKELDLEGQNPADRYCKNCTT